MSASTTARTIKTKAEQAKRETMENPFVEGLARGGYIARGVIYALIGLLAVQLAFANGGQATDQNGAIQMIGAQPFGKWLLILLTVGLLGYSMWGFIRAFFDALGRGHDMKGLIERFGFLVSGVTYGALAAVAFKFATGSGNANAGKPQDMSAQLMSHPYGQWFVAILGVFWIISALAQFYLAWTASFKKDFQPGLPMNERKWAEWLGRFGYAARGVVFGLIGWFLIVSAMRFDPNQAVGLDGALLKLTQEPYGMPLLAVVALGLVAFGVYSALCARWIRVFRPSPKGNK
ncbi:MAG TPA: DUF1206 domain-containing protein [Anaerolineae bacterium]|nr:DUF1206 domain-containing protein [Anaerolineae bacterium]